MAQETTQYPQEFLDHVRSITNKRARIVIDHIMQHGAITTEDLEKIYGYNHPPRAARDVREAGIPLETFKVKSGEGKSIAAYRFGDIRQIQASKIAGRMTHSKKFKRELYEQCQGHCQVCNEHFEERYLQIDHRVPYEISGDTEDRTTENFMLVCGSCNRAKSWSCEQCENWIQRKDQSICKRCYWGMPTNYTHIAMKEVRRLDLQWSGDEIHDYDMLKSIAEQKSTALSTFAKQVLANNQRKK